MSPTLERISRWADWALVPAGLALVAYQMLTVWYSVHGSMQHYVTHMSGVLVIASLIAIAGASSGATSRMGYFRVLAALVAGGVAVYAGVYLYVNIPSLEVMQPFVGDEALMIGMLLVAAVLILAWLLWGLPLALLCAAAVAYFAYGHHLPPPFGTSQTQPNVVVSFLAGFGGPRGVFSFMPLSADMIFLLLVYGGFLYGCRVIEMFTELGRAIGNLFRGGVAYSAVVASSLIGMVTGQAVSNIALSGTMTIPTMRRNGFTAEQAGAIEVMASTGSQLLPPIMGLGAFLMAEILGVAYFDIVTAALIPALLFMAAVILGVFAMIGSSKEIPFEKMEVDWRKVWAVAPSFLLSFIALIGLLYMRYSPAMAGFWALVALLPLSWLRAARYRPTLSDFRNGAHQGITTAIYLALMLAVIGLVVQMLSTTGTGLSLGRLVSMLTGDSPILGLLIGMGVALLIGMGLPTPAAYALIAVVVVPALIDSGLAPLTAHMYGFYFAILSTLTPPIAVGVLTAMRISGGTFLGTTKECFALGGVCFLVPFAFVAMPELLAPRELGLEGVFGIAMALFATAMLSAGIYGAFGVRLRAMERIGAVIIGPVSFLLYLWDVGWWLALVGPFALAAWLILGKPQREAVDITARRVRTEQVD